MKRKEFLKKSILASALAPFATISAKAEATVLESDTKKDAVGFNHLPNKEIKTMKTVLHKSNTRGVANHGWLKSNHSFSFANWYNPQRMGFGALRVLNDDWVQGGQGFGKHPHDNMEIVSIPLKGDLEHKDSMGTKAVIKQGDIQVMSAGTGIYHSEYNKNAKQPVEFLQIWVFPNKKDVTPRYDQITLYESKMKNQLYQILSPNKDDDGVWVHQNAWFHMGNLDKGFETTYELKSKESGVYAFVLEGNMKVEGQDLNRRDGFGIWDTDKITIKASSNSQILLMEVPMDE